MAPENRTANRRVCDGSKSPQNRFWKNLLLGSSGRSQLLGQVVRICHWIQRLVQQLDPVAGPAAGFSDWGTYLAIRSPGFCQVQTPILPVVHFQDSMRCPCVMKSPLKLLVRSFYPHSEPFSYSVVEIFVLRLRRRSF